LGRIRLCFAVIAERFRPRACLLSVLYVLAATLRTLDGENWAVISLGFLLFTASQGLRFEARTAFLALVAHDFGHSEALCILETIS
jgi:hypothetical protein